MEIGLPRTKGQAECWHYCPFHAESTSSYMQQYAWTVIAHPSLYSVSW